MNKEILIIDDDKDLSFIMRQMLESYGYSVSVAYDGNEALALLTNHTYHLILLDINLPDSNGYELCIELRRTSSVPVIFASARTSKNDQIKGLDIGGDDYLSKPYSMKELLSHVNAVIRRTYGFSQKEEIVSFGSVTVNLTSRTVSKNETTISLSLKEFDLLACLVRHKNTAMNKDILISEVWGAFSEVEPSTLTVHIRWLREKLEDDPGSPMYIKTLRGLGYLLQI